MAERSLEMKTLCLSAWTHGQEPFGLSLSKPLACGTKAPFDRFRASGTTSSARPLDKLRANRYGELTVVKSRTGPITELRPPRLGPRSAKRSS
jgi:hypothetical protein